MNSAHGARGSATRKFNATKPVEAIIKSEPVANLMTPLVEQIASSTVNSND